MIRPEVGALARRWREVIAAAALAAFGLWTLSGGGYVLLPLGLAIVALAAGWGLIALRRIRFLRGIDAPGFVEVDEGQVGYFGPTFGGFVALADLAELCLAEHYGARAWRLRTGDWRSIFFPTGDDFLVAAIGLRKDIYDRADRMRLSRRGEGVTVIEAAMPRVADEGARASAVTSRRAHRAAPAPQNGFSPFDDAMLQRIDGVDDDVLAFLRAMPPSVDAPGVLAEELSDVDLAFLLADLWERPQHHLERFEAGGVPSVEELDIEDAELRVRLEAPASKRSR